MTPPEELAALIDAARDQENRLHQQGEELDTILTELRTELDALKKLRTTYENDLHQMRPIWRAIKGGAEIRIEHPAPPLTWDEAWMRP